MSRLDPTLLGVLRDRPPVLEEVLADLRPFMPHLETLGLSNLAIFGPVSKGTARPGSDVDLLATVVDPKNSLATVVKVQQALTNSVGHPTNLVLLGLGDAPVIVARLHASLLENIQPDLVPLS
jgi:predicted nucleotidyltransferase